MKKTDDVVEVQCSKTNFNQEVHVEDGRRGRRQYDLRVGIEGKESIA